MNVFDLFKRWISKTEVCNDGKFNSLQKSFEEYISNYEYRNCAPFRTVTITSEVRRSGSKRRNPSSKGYGTTK